MKSKSEEEARKLLQKYESGECTPHERALVESWLNEVSVAAEEPDGEPDYAHLQQKLFPDIRKRKTWPIRWQVAAAVLFVAAIGGYFVVDSRQSGVGSSESSVVSQMPSDIRPGGNKAVLTMANGSVVDLSEAQNGIIVGDGLTYLDGSSVIDSRDKGQDSRDARTENPDSYVLILNSISTPKGGTYQIILPDGTKVWLNAASTLKYPDRFSGDTREVFLEGEGYFAVDSRQPTAGGKKPFIVKTNGQEAVVLGTEFNISAYSDEQKTVTTLVSGAVRVSVREGSPPDQLPITNHQSPVTSSYQSLLKPGEQAVVTAGQLQTGKADVSSAVAWKEGKFRFSNTRLTDVLNQLSRWYDVEVEYRGKVPDSYVYAVMNRESQLSEVLNILREAGVKFRIEKTGAVNRLVVLP